MWVTAIGALPAEEASLFLTIIPTGMASFYKYRQQSREAQKLCTEALQLSLVPPPQSVLLPKGLTPHSLNSACQ